jgi:hypothetical protein
MERIKVPVRRHLFSKTDSFLNILLAKVKIRNSIKDLYSTSFRPSTGRHILPRLHILSCFAAVSSLLGVFTGARG